MALKGRRHFEVKVTTTHSEFANMSFGPFVSKEDAAAELRRKGWHENVDGEEGVWYCEIDHRTGIHGRIVPVTLLPPREIPKGRSS